MQGRHGIREQVELPTTPRRYPSICVWTVVVELMLAMTGCVINAGLSLPSPPPLLLSPVFCFLLPSPPPLLFISGPEEDSAEYHQELQ